MSLFKKNTKKHIKAEFLRMSMYYEARLGHDHGIYQLFMNEWRYTK